MERRRLTMPFWLVRDVVVAAIGVALMILARRPAPEPTAAAASWHLQLRALGHRPSRVIFYGKQSGLHIVRLPVGDDLEGEASVVPLSVVDREVWFVAPGGRRFFVRGNPTGSNDVRVSGNGRVMKVYRSSEATGIRVW